MPDHAPILHLAVAARLAFLTVALPGVRRVGSVRAGGAARLPAIRLVLPSRAREAVLAPGRSQQRHTGPGGAWHRKRAPLLGCPHRLFVPHGLCVSPPWPISLFFCLLIIAVASLSTRYVPRSLCLSPASGHALAAQLPLFRTSWIAFLPSPLVPLSATAFANAARTRLCVAASSSTVSSDLSTRPFVTKSLSPVHTADHGTRLLGRQLHAVGLFFCRAFSHHCLLLPSLLFDGSVRFS